MAPPRPAYETDGDLLNEGMVAATIEKKFDCTLWKLPRSARIDFAVIRKNEIVGFVEVKVRRVSRNEHRTYMLSLQKYLAALNLCKRTGLPCLLVVRWTDSTGVLVIDGPVQGTTVSTGGRRDRGDPMDVEEVVHIPMELFSPM